MANPDSGSFGGGGPAVSGIDTPSFPSPSVTNAAVQVTTARFAAAAAVAGTETADDSTSIAISYVYDSSTSPAAPAATASVTSAGVKGEFNTATIIATALGGSSLVLCLVLSLFLCSLWRKRKACRCAEEEPEDPYAETRSLAFSSFSRAKRPKYPAPVGYEHGRLPKMGWPARSIRSARFGG